MLAFSGLVYDGEDVGGRAAPPCCSQPSPAGRQLPCPALPRHAGGGGATPGCAQCQPPPPPLLCLTKGCCAARVHATGCCDRWPHGWVSAAACLLQPQRQRERMIERLNKQSVPTLSKMSQLFEVRQPTGPQQRVGRTARASGARPAPRRCRQRQGCGCAPALPALLPAAAPPLPPSPACPAPMRARWRPARTRRSACPACWPSWRTPRP